CYRKKLKVALYRYANDTLSFFDTVKGFCEEISTWTDERKTELNKMREIKDRADKMNFSYVTQSKGKWNGFKEYVKCKLTPKLASSRRAELETKLAAVLEDTLRGLKQLDRFQDAVEKLAVTSLHVFMEENQVLHLPKGISPEQVQNVIAAARLICPLLLGFKRDPSVFFLPRLQNVEVLSYQLDKYIQTTQKICDKLEKRQHVHRMTTAVVVELSEDLSEEDAQRMLCHMTVLQELRMDQHFRMVFLFQKTSCSEFISKFSECQPRMLQFLNDLEGSAVQLDKVSKGAKISSVAGSSVGATGGVISIVGLALSPVTAGVSLGLTITGAVLGILSGVNSGVTTATETVMNRKRQKKASETFQSFMEDVQRLQDCLDEVMSRAVIKIEASKFNVAVGICKVLSKAGTVGKKIIDSVIDVASGIEMLKAEQLIASAGKVVAQEGKALRNVPKMASDIPDIGQAAVKGPFALSKSARAGFIVANALFLGMDIFFICKDSISLSKGSETEVSQFIRTRSALWRSEMDSWQKICDSLREGRLTSEKHQAVLDKPFYLPSS
ncbi:Apolipoprotein L3, partial [Nibea albiflora]